MKVGFEVSPLLVKNMTGVDHYAKNLVDAALKFDQTNTYYLVYIAFMTKAEPDLRLEQTNFVRKRISYLPGKLYNLFLRLPIGLPIDALAGAKADVYVFPNFVRWPLLYTRKSIVVVHDLAYLDLPGVIKTWHHLRYLRWAVPRSIRKATRVIAISQSTKDAIIRHYGTSPDKIAVITPSIDHARFVPASPSEVEVVQAKYAITRPYVLYLGTLEPRKNIMGIVRAYIALPDEVKKKFQLVLAGGQGWLTENDWAEIREIDSDDVVLTGYIDDADRVPLYSGAEVFFYPSFYEGWGMQVLEAMACGTPVLTAGNTSLPEAGGDAAVYVDADDQASINAGLVEVLASDKKRQQMKKAGLAHVATFSWDKSGAQLVELINQVGKAT